MNKRGVPVVVILILLVSEGIDTFAQYCFKRAADAQGPSTISSIADVISFVVGAVSQGYLWIGIAAIAIVFVSWTAVLSKTDLSVAIPMTSFSYVFVALVSLLFLHEHISALRWTGILFILLGVAIVSSSADRTGNGSK